jgi:molybdopterin-binding protein
VELGRQHRGAKQARAQERPTTPLHCHGGALSWIGMDRSKLLRYNTTSHFYSDQIHREGSKHMKLSARNVLKGRIVEIARASTMTRISLDIGGGNIVNAAVTTVAVDDLKLAVGKEAYAVVDATNVMVGVD